MMGVWELRVVNGIIHAVELGGNSHIEMNDPGPLSDYIGDGCKVRAYISDRMFVIIEKIGGPSPESIR